MKLQVLDSIPDILKVRKQWETLLRRSECDLAFNSLAWYVGCCAAGNKKPHVFLLRDDKEIKAILQLIKDDIDGSFQFVSMLSDFNDVITGQSDLYSAVILMKEIVNYIERNERIDLTDVREESILWRAIDKYEKDAKVIIKKGISHHYVVEVPKTYQDYLASRSKSFKRDLIRKRSKADKNGFTIDRYQPKKERVCQFLDTFLSLHKSRIVNSVLFYGDNEQVVRNVVGELLVSGVFVAFVLRRGDELQAIQLSVKNDKYLGYWNGGFSVDIESLSPGKLLFENQIMFCIENDIGEFDLLRGGENYKKAWATKKRKLFSVSIFGLEGVQNSVSV